MPHDLSNFLEETHLEQAVRLVEHQRGEILQTHAVRVAHVVDHPPGSRDDDLGARAKARGLHVRAETAHHQRGADGCELRQPLRHLVHLHGELARGHEDENVRRRHRSRPAVKHALEKWEHERGGLTRTGDRATADVSAGEREGHHRGLDGRRGVVPERSARLDQLTAEVELREGGGREGRVLTVGASNNRAFGEHAIVLLDLLLLNLLLLLLLVVLAVLVLFILISFRLLVLLLVLLLVALVLLVVVLDLLLVAVRLVLFLAGKTLVAAVVFVVAVVVAVGSSASTRFTAAAALQSVLDLLVYGRGVRRLELAFNLMLGVCACDKWSV